MSWFIPHEVKCKEMRTTMMQVSLCICAVWLMFPAHCWCLLLSRPVWVLAGRKPLNLKNEPKGRWPWNLVCSIGYSSITNFVQMMTMGWPWHILRQGQIWYLLLLYGEKGKTMDFSEYQVGRCSLPNEYRIPPCIIRSFFPPVAV